MIGAHIFDNSLYNSIDVTVGVFILYIIVSIVYLKSKHGTDFQSKLYLMMGICTYMAIIVNITNAIVYFINPAMNLFINITGRISIVLVTCYMGLVLLYLNSCIEPEKMKNKKYKTKMVILTLACIITSLIIFLPMELVYDTPSTNGLHVYATMGPAARAPYALAVVLFIIYIMSFIKYFKNFTRELKIAFVYSFIGLIIGFMSSILLSASVALTPTILMLFNIILFFTNESTSVKLIENLKSKKYELERSNKAQEDFLSTVSHDIRTPMNVIMGYSNSIVNDKDITPNEIKNDAENMSIAVQDLYSIVNRILDVSKLSSGNQELKLVDYDLIELIQNIIDEISPIVKKENIGFNIDVNPNIPHYLNGDKEKLYELLVLIIKNIINNRSSHVDVKFDGEIKNDIITLIIRINHKGSYFKKEDLNIELNDYLSEISKDSDSFKSDFLGVIIAKEFINLLGGTMSYEENINTWYEIKIDEKITNLEKISETELYKAGKRGEK